MEESPVSTPRRSSTFGVIAIVVAILAFMTPKFLLSLMLLALTIFIVLGFVRDGSKIYSLIALGMGLFLFYLIGQEAAHETEQYSVRYEVTCQDCNARWTNVTGGTDEEKNVKGTWTKTISAQGDQFLHLSAQNNQYGYSVTSRIYVNDKQISSEQSSGDYAVASASCRPEDFYTK